MKLKYCNTCGTELVLGKSSKSQNFIDGKEVLEATLRCPRKKWYNIHGCYDMHSFNGGLSWSKIWDDLI